MAYKFQLGAAVLSGSIKADDGIVATAVDATTADNVVSSLGNADIPSAKVALADGSVLIGDSNGHATARSLSGDITSNNAGAVTIANNAVSLAKMAGLAAGKFILGDSNGDPAAVTLSGDATVSAAGAITIAANAVEGSMINSNAAGDALAYSSNALNVQVSGALKVAGDKIGITGSFAGAGLVGLGGADAASSIAIDIGGLPALGGATVAQTDEFLFDDAGTLKKLQFTNLEDSIFGNISSDVLIAAGGAATIQADAVTYAKIQNVSATDRILGRDSAGAGVVEEISPASLRTMINVENGSTADQTAVEIIGLLNSDLGGAFTIGSQADDLATFKGPVTIEGNLTVLGTSVEIDAGFIVTSSVKFEGTTPDGNETELIATNPTADRTITLPDLSGHVPLIAGAATAGSIAVTAAEFALLDGGSTIGTTALNKDDGFMHNDNGTMKHTKIEKLGDFLAGSALASVSGQLALDIGGLAAYTSTIAQTDEFVFDDAGTLKKVQFTHLEDSVFASVSGDATVAAGGALTIAAGAVEGSMLNNNVISGQSTSLASGLADTDEFLISDAGTIKKMDASVLKSYVAADILDVAVKAAGGTLAVGVNYFEDMSSDGEDAVALPGSPVVGQSVRVKAPSDCSEARYITINRAGSQTIDGATSIRLESPFAAVELVYVANDLWRVF